MKQHIRDPIHFENKLLHYMNPKIKQKKLVGLRKSNKQMSIKDLQACTDVLQRERERKNIEK